MNKNDIATSFQIGAIPNNIMTIICLSNLTTWIAMLNLVTTESDALKLELVPFVSSAPPT